MPNGKEALEYLLAAAQFHWKRISDLPMVIILDLAMPQMDGFEFLRRVKAEPTIAAIPVVVLTTSQFDQDLTRSYALGASSCLTKPGNFEQLVKLVADVDLHWCRKKLLERTSPMSPLMDVRNWPVRFKVAGILAVTLVPLIGIMLLYLNTLQRFPTDHEAEVNRLYAVQLQTESIRNQMTDVQDGFGGFVLTRNEKFLTPFYEAQENLDPSLQQLKDLTRNEPDRQEQVTQIEERARSCFN